MEFFSSFFNFDNQSAGLIAFSILLSFMLSGMIVFTYEKVSRDIVMPDHFLQSIILMAIVTTTIMQSIGDSMARGFGIFGALAILRFRTQLISPRNISFIFAAMAVGIACGVYSFATATIGTLAFCLAAFFLRLTPFSRKNRLKGELRMEIASGETQKMHIEQVLRSFTRQFTLSRHRVLPGNEGQVKKEFSYHIRLDDESRGAELVTQLNELAGAQNVRLTFEDTYY